MSHSRLFFFDKNNEIIEVKELQNAWGGAAYIWDCLYNKYLKNPDKEYDNWLSSVMKEPNKLWNLVDDERLPMFAKVCLMYTFDRIIVKKENFVKLSQDFDEFVKFFPPNNKICHLPTISQLLKENFPENISFMATWQTSCSEATFLDWNETTEKYTVKPNLVDLYETLVQI